MEGGARGSGQLGRRRDLGYKGLQGMGPIGQCKSDITFAEGILGSEGGHGGGREDSHSLEMLYARLQYPRFLGILHAGVKGEVAA